MHFPLLQDILILLGFSVIIVFFLQRIKLPSVLGFLVTGVIIGPYALSLVTAVEQVEILSEIGVILLLFVIGMELSIKQLISIRKTVFIGGSLQVGLTILVTTGIYYFFINSWSQAVFVGFLFSLSSTAIVLTVLQQKNELNFTHGRNSLGILIFQDIIVVPMMLITPILAGNSSNILLSIIGLIMKSAVVIIITIISARYLVPRLMHAIALTRSKELFLLTTITICFAVAYLTSLAGLSLALGAFLAGLIISESEYSHQATSIILPFRELFISFFFISVGMLLDLGFFIENIWIILALLTFVSLLKLIVVYVAVRLLDYPSKTAFLTALALFQVGEFAFILSKVGISNEMLSEVTNQYFLSVSILTMLITPFVIIYSDRILRFFKTTLVGNMLKETIHGAIIPDVPNNGEIENHLVIIGYGINGSNLAKAAEFGKIDYRVVDFDPEIVSREQKKGVPIMFGDASQVHILEALYVSHANGVVIAISDPEATKLIIANIRSISQTVYIMVRTRYVRDISELIALGADDVIPEEFETSVEIFSRVLENFLIPINEIDHFVDSLRADNYKLFQSKKRVPQMKRMTEPHDFRMSCARVEIDSGDLVNHTIQDARLKEKYGIYLYAIGRKNKVIYELADNTVILQNDLLFFHGNPDQVERFREIIT